MRKKQLTQDERIGKLERVVTQLYLSYTVLKSKLEKLEKPTVILLMFLILSCSENEPIDICSCNKTTYVETVRTNGFRIWTETQIQKRENIGCSFDNTNILSDNRTVKIYEVTVCNK